MMLRNACDGDDNELLRDGSDVAVLEKVRRVLMVVGHATTQRRAGSGWEFLGNVDDAADRGDEGEERAVMVPGGGRGFL